MYTAGSWCSKIPAASKRLPAAAVLVFDAITEVRSVRGAGNAAHQNARVGSSFSKRILSVSTGWREVYPPRRSVVSEGPKTSTAFQSSARSKALNLRLRQYRMPVERMPFGRARP